MTSPKPDNQNRKFDEDDLKRRPIHRDDHYETGIDSKAGNLYPPLNSQDECHDHDMDDDTHSVQNGFADRDEDDWEITNSPNIDVECKSPLKGKSDVNEMLSPNQKEIVDALSKGKGKNTRQRNKAKISHEPEQRYNIQTNLSGATRRNLLQNEYSPEEKKMKTPVAGISSYYWWILLLILGFALFYSFSLNSSANTIIWNYQSIVSNFKDSFIGQPPFSFKIFKAALKSINQTDPSAPAIILFLASKGAEEFARNLGEKLVHSVSPSPIKIYGKDFAHLDTDTGKKLIDDALRSMKANMHSNYGAVLVEDLHRIPGGTALMLHTYCDSENAPFKRAVYALIVDMEDIIQRDSRGKEWEDAVYKRLNQAWTDIDEDQRSPLLSRLTVSVVAIFENNMTV